MPRKSGKYGLKFWILADAEYHYCCNPLPNFGKDGDKKVTNLGSQIVKALASPVHNTDCNIILDRYFTGVELFEDLLTKGLTVTKYPRMDQMKYAEDSL